MKKIPLVNLRIQHEKLKDEIDCAINDVIKNSQFIRGPYVEKFENDFANLAKTIVRGKDNRANSRGNSENVE